MKNQKLFNALTNIREDIIVQAADHTFQTKKRFHSRRVAAIASTLCACLLLGIFFWPASNAVNGYIIVEAAYPEMAPYPNEENFFAEDGSWNDVAYEKEYDAWLEDQQTKQQPEGYADGLQSFITDSTRQFLSGSETENRVYSPINVYMALGMLAEITDGSSRQQILDSLGNDSIDSLRQQASSIWMANYNDDGFFTSILSSSLWLSDTISFKQETMQTLADTYYASSFRGPMGSDEFNQQLQNWLNAQTRNNLKDQTNNIQMDPDTILSIATTVYYSAKWTNEFAESATAPDTFHALTEDLTCDFMHQSSIRDYYWGEKFTAVAQTEMNGGSMLFILPNEGVSIDELLYDAETMDFILADMSDQTWDQSEAYLVNFSVPKFDVESTLDLTSGLFQMGITDVFDPSISDFSSMTDDVADICLSSVTHGAHFAIDEEGCEAAAYTVMMATSTCAEEEIKEIDFTLNRPFLFVTINSDGLPLFVGIVNQPV